jgi:hypothetical protein
LGRLSACLHAGLRAAVASFGEVFFRPLRGWIGCSGMRVLAAKDGGWDTCSRSSLGRVGARPCAIIAAHNWLYRRCVYLCFYWAGNRNVRHRSSLALPSTTTPPLQPCSPRPQQHDHGAVHAAAAVFYCWLPLLFLSFAPHLVPLPLPTPFDRREPPRANFSLLSSTLRPTIPRGHRSPSPTSPPHAVYLNPPRHRPRSPNLVDVHSGL